MTSEEVKTSLILLGFKEANILDTNSWWKVHFGPLKVSYTSNNIYLFTHNNVSQRNYWFGKDVVDRVIKELDGILL